MRFASWVAVLAMGVGCGGTMNEGDTSGSDGANLDAGLRDAAAMDPGTDAAPEDSSTRDIGSGDTAADVAGLDAAGRDTGTNTDGGATDAATDTADATSPIDSGSVDASDGGTEVCEWDAFVSGRPGTGRVPLMEGDLCDDVFVCVEDLAHAARVMSAGPRFQCSMSSETPCPGMGCVFRDPGGPSTLDRAELAEICAVTRVAPRPTMTCRIYL